MESSLVAANGFVCLKVCELACVGASSGSKQSRTKEWPFSLASSLNLTGETEPASLSSAPTLLLTSKACAQTSLRGPEV